MGRAAGEPGWVFVGKVFMFQTVMLLSSFLIEIFGQSRIVRTSISTSSTPTYRHDPQEADTVRAEEPVP